MKACIVFAHPGESSFNHEILRRVRTACDRHGINHTVRDLYQMKFQPVFTPADMHGVEQNRLPADIAEEQQLITESDLLVMIYPVWWWAQPAILKGWIDRVFTDKFAFRYEPQGPVGLLHGKQALVITTTRESDEEMRAKGYDEVVKKQIVDGTLAFAGFDVLYRNFGAVPYVTDDERESMLREAEELVSRVRTTAKA